MRINKYIKKQFKVCKRLAFEFGQFKSIKSRMAVDKDGKEIPWYTYPFIEYLNQLDFSECKVFEYGCGNSSIYWARKVQSIKSVDNNRTWFEKISKKKLNNQTILLCEDKDKYINAINQDNKLYNIIIVDGRHRSECIKEIFKHLEKGGMIILDNSERYPKMSKYLRGKDLIQVDFAGFGPINSSTWVSSVFLSRDFSIKPLRNQPELCIGGAKEIIN